MRGYAREVVETMTRRKVDICCVQKIGWSGASAWLITEKESKYKIFWVGNRFALGGVKLLVARNWIDKIFDMECVNDRLMMIKLFTGKQILAVVSTYTKQQRLAEEFHKDLISLVSKVG